MTQFFEKRDRWGHGMALWVLVAMVFVAPPALWSLKQIHLENDIENWLPEDDPQAVMLRWYLKNFEHEDSLLVTWEGSSLNDPRVERFATRVRGVEDSTGVRRNGLKQVDRVITPRDVLARVDEDVVRDEAIHRLKGVLIGTGPVKVRLSEAGRNDEQRVIEALTKRAKAKLNLDIQVLPAFVEWSDPVQTVNRSSTDSNDASTTDSLESEPLVPMGVIPAHDFQVRWAGMQVNSQRTEQFRELAIGLQPTGKADGSAGWIDDCFIVPGSPVALSVALSEAGLADKSGTMEEIRRIAQEVGISSAELHLGGRPVASSELNQSVKKAAWNREAPITQLHRRSVILLSGLVGIGLAFVMLRSFRLATLVLFISYYTVLLAVSLVPLTGGSMNMVLVVMPTLLLVLTMSGAIHVANYWKNAAHKNLGTAVVEATRMARTPCLLASVTTAIGLLSLSTSSLTPVRDFGIYSAIGSLLSLVMVLYGLPALLQIWPAGKPDVQDVDRRGWQELGRILARYRILVTTAALVLFAVGICGLNWFHTETKAIRYFPENAPIVRDYRFLEENIAGIVPVDVIVRFDSDAQSDLNFLQRMEIVRQIENQMREHSEISGTLSLADFRPTSEKPPENASSIQKLMYHRRAATMESRIREEHSSAIKRFLTVADEPADLDTPGDQELNQAGDELWRITAQVAIMSDLNYGDLTADLDKIAQSTLRYHPGSGHVVTGMVPLFLRTQQAVLESLIRSFALAFGVIAVVMIIVLKNPIAGLIAMLPNLLPIAVVFGLISWYGIAVDIGTMITASVALGIAVDGTLHLLTWFQTGIASGKSRVEAVAHALGHCGPAMWQTSFAVGTGLLMLYPADLLLISRFGWLMAALIGMALVADVILLPALLAGPLGRLIERTNRGVQSEPVAANETTPHQPVLEPHLRVTPSSVLKTFQPD